MIFNQQGLSESEVKLLVKAADNVYQNQMSLDGWQVITPDLINPNYGLNSELITGNTFRAEGDLLNVPFGDANAAVLKSGDNLLLAFRGTEIPEGDEGYWLRLEEHYDLFEPLFTALDNYIQANPASKILVTGHSLGAAMAEFYMAEHPGASYSAVTVASPTASNDPTDTRILNIGFENDPVYEITSGDPFGVGIGGADPSNSTTNLFLDLDVTGLAGINNHASSEYVYAVGRLFDSAYYDQTKRDSFVLIDRKNSSVNVSDVYLSTDQDVFILGEDNKADDITGDKKDDILEGLGGNDTLEGDKISASFFSGNDTLNGGVGNDSLDGNKGDQDVAIFSDDFANYDYSVSEDKKTITFAHARGTQTDGTDTLKNIEWGAFKDTTQPLGIARLASATPTAPRIIPLPLEDGILDTEAVKATDTTPNPNTNDLPTPPHVSLTAPVAMLDGNVDYTLNISPFKPDTQYNISYIFDTSASMDAGELQTAKNAYTDLTNYFINNGLAENINFGVVKFSRNATLYKDLTAQQAISTIQGLTSSPAIEGTKYNDALYQGLNFFSQSPLKGTTNIAYFVSDGRSQTNFSDPNDVSYVFDAMNLRRVSNVQAFGIYDPTDPGGVTSSQINFVDSNNGVLVNNINDLSTELNKSGLAGKVNQVNILVDGVVVDTIQPSELTDSPLGLTYEGSVEDLDVSVNAENVITAQVVFNDNTATTAVDYNVTAGEGKLTDGSGNPIDESGNTSGDEDPFERIRNGGDSNDEITLGYSDRGGDGGAGGDYIVGNKRNNTLDGGIGNDTILGHEGNDKIITGTGTNKVDGGEGIDTVVYDDVVYQGNNISLRQAANTVSYNNTDSLTDVEFIQFSDVRINAETLQITPVVEVNDLEVAEGISGNTVTQLMVELDHPAPVNVQFDYSTQDLDAIAGTDYIAASGQVVIPAGETTANIELEVINDTAYDEVTETFAINLSNLWGATFADNNTEYSVISYIENQEKDLSLTGGTGDDFLAGGVGNDTIDGGDGNDSLYGESGNDVLLGGKGEDAIYGGTDADKIYGQANQDFIYGNDGDDSLYGESGNDIIIAGQGKDLLDGGTGNDKLFGQSDDDRLLGNDGDDSLYGESGNDIIIAGQGKDLLDGSTGNDKLFGQSDDDRLLGNDGNDSLYGESGNDIIIAGQGEDLLEGSTGNDKLFGQANNDFLFGQDGNDSLYGESNHDSIQGGAGDDLISGGSGDDTLMGEAGSDSFVFNNPNEGVDLITDFSVLDDTFVFSAAGFEGISLAGIIESELFTVGTAASSSEHRFIYDAGSGNLFYDSDGVENNQQIRLATLETALALTNNDFYVDL